MRECRTRFKTVLLQQMAPDGSFPRELGRTKPYGYSLFNLEAMATICQILSTPEDDLWTFELPDGRGMRKAMAYMAPYIRDKKSWPKPPDVMYHEHWPMRQASLLFAGVALKAAVVHGALVLAAGGFGRRGDRPQLLHPPAAPLVRLGAVQRVHRVLGSRFAGAR